MKSGGLSLLLLCAIMRPAAAQTEVPVAPTDDGGSVKRLVLARSFELEKPHRYEWRQDKPLITQGTILVLQVDPELARPRNIAAPVLYVGETPAERINIGFESGFLIVIVPGEPDLTKTPIYFGSVELPERVDAARGRRELEAARKKGVRPHSEDVVREARKKGGEPLRAYDTVDLYATISDLILIYAPDETERAQAYRDAAGY